MYKKIISFFLALLMLLSLCACRRKNPAEISESFVGTPVAVVTEEPQATPAHSPNNGTPAPMPTLNWIESEDGQSMTATVPVEDGKSIQVSIGVNKDGSIPDDDIVDTNDSTTPVTTNAPASTSVPTEGTETTMAPATEAPAATQPPVTGWTGPNTATTLAQYEAMSGNEQMLFYYSFANADDFNAWYSAAKAAQEANSGDILIG